MDAWAIFGWVLAVVLAGVGVYFRLTGKGTEASYFDQLASMQAAARDAVAAAEQLWTTGKLQQNERFAYAFNELKKLYPTLDEGMFTMTIEAAVFWLKKGVEVWQAQHLVGTGDGNVPVGAPDPVPGTNLSALDVGGVVLPVRKG